LERDVGLNFPRPPRQACLSDVLAIVLDRLEHILAEIGDVRTEQQRQGETLAAIVRALDRRAPRDAADVALLIAIAQAWDQPFTCHALLEHARTLAPTVREALLACDVVTTTDLGWWCRRLEASPRQDVWIERAGDSRDGVLWRVRLSASPHRDE